MLAILNTCRQLYHEVITLWLKHIRIVTDLESLGLVLQWVIDWPPSHFDQVARVDIRILSGHWDNPGDTDLWILDRTVPRWILLEEFMEGQGVQLNAMFQMNVTTRVWGKAYRTAKRCRSAGMSLIDVAEVIYEMADVGCLIQEQCRSNESEG